MVSKSSPGVSKNSPGTRGPGVATDEKKAKNKNLQNVSESDSAKSDKSARSGTAGKPAVGRISSYLSESVEELKRVSKPTRQETIQATIVTLALVLFFAIVLAALDWAFRGLMWAIF